jgi:Carboxypeptidase regulatory-like domain
MNKVMMVLIAVCVLAIGTALPAISADLAGEVVDQDGHAVSGATITTQGPDGQTVASATSNSQGEYEINGLNAGEYLITIGSASAGLQSQTVASYVGGNGLAVNWLVAPGVAPLASAQPLAQDERMRSGGFGNLNLRDNDRDPQGCFRKSDKLFCDNGRACRVFPYGYYYCRCCQFDRFD